MVSKAGVLGLALSGLLWTGVSSGAPGRLACDTDPQEDVRARIQFRPTHQSGGVFIGSVFLALDDGRVEIFRSYPNVELSEEEGRYTLYYSDGSLHITGVEESRGEGELIYFGTTQTHRLAVDCTITQ